MAAIARRDDFFETVLSNATSGGGVVFVLKGD